MTEYIRPKYCHIKMVQSITEEGVDLYFHGPQELLPHPLGCKYLYLSRFVRIIRPSTSPSHTNTFTELTYPPSVAPDAICHGAQLKFPHSRLPLPLSGCTLTASFYDSEECSCGYHAAYCPSCLDYTMEEEHKRPCSKILVAPVGTTYWHANAWRAQSYRTLAAFLIHPDFDIYDPPPSHEPWPTEFPTFYVTPDTINQKIVEVAKEIVLEHALREETT